MIKRTLVLFGAAAALAAAIIMGCGTSGGSSTGCDANLPCTVSINVN